MKKETPLIDREYLMQKFPGKGGWTYVVIPEIIRDKRQRFGWVRVSGSIDGYELRQYKLMPMGNDRLFLPVRAAIRKAIRKEAGDFVKVILYPDETPLEIPAELTLCFENEPKELYQAFLDLKEGEQKMYLDQIYSAKSEETKVQRIVKMMEELQKKL